MRSWRGGRRKRHARRLSRRRICEKVSRRFSSGGCPPGPGADDLSLHLAQIQQEAVLARAHQSVGHLQRGERVAGIEAWLASLFACWAVLDGATQSRPGVTADGGRKR